MNRLDYFVRLSIRRRALLIASITWLAAGTLVGTGILGSFPLIVWSPVGAVLFLGLNACAGAIVVSEFLLSTHPNWEGRRFLMLQLTAGIFFVVSAGSYYFSFAGSHGGLAF